MKKLSELREIAIMCACVDMCNRAVEYRASTKLFRISEDIERFINHEIGDQMAAKKELIIARQEELIIPFREELDQFPEKQKEIDSNYAEAIKNDEQLRQINEEIAALWEQEALFDIPVVEVPYRDFSESFPSEKKSGVFVGFNWKADGLSSFKSLDRQGIVKVI